MDRRRGEAELSVGAGRRTLAALNAADADTFVALLDGVFERSPWIPRAVHADRPFDSVASLHAAMLRVVQTAGAERQLALLQAHPALARSEPLTVESAAEQGRLGLDRLATDEASAFAALNNTYLARFGFPFIIAVRGQRDRAAILAALSERLHHAPEQELAAALAEVAKITRFRLDDLVADENDAG